MRPINYLEIDYIYNRIATEIQEIVAEDRITEWVGEVMEFIRTPLKQEKGIYVLKVDNWQAEFPRGLHTLINVARFNGCLPQNLSLCCGEEKEQTEHQYHSHTHHHTCISCTPPSNTETINNSQNEDNIINTIPYECDCKDPCDCCNDFIFIQHPYIPLNLAVTEENKEIEFLRVANRPYFESDPCMGIKNTSCRHEYSIVGTTERQFRLSFESGYILVSGYQIALDKRGLPLIIDMPDVINAIIYYIKWKVSEFKWMNDPTVQQNHLVQYNRQMYEKYCKQSKTALKMPHGVDDYHDLLEFQNRISTDSFYYTFFNRTIKLK